MRTIDEICKTVEEDYKNYINQRRSLYEAFEEKRSFLLNALCFRYLLVLEIRSK